MVVSSPLQKLFGKRAVVAVGEILKAEVLIDLEQRLVVADAAVPGLRGLAGSEEAQRAAFHFVVGRGVPQFPVGKEGHAALADGKGREVVGDELQAVGAAEERNPPA